MEQVKDSRQRTYTGLMVDVFDLDLGTICIADIAHALAYQNRFNGHAVVPISVATHSLFVAAMLPEPFKLEGLLHDASDAYLGDVVSPVKHHAILKPFQDLEKFVQAQIYFKFGVNPSESSHQIVKAADDWVYFYERDYHLIGQRGSPMRQSPEDAEKEFLKLFYSLYDSTNSSDRESRDHRLKGNLVS